MKPMLTHVAGVDVHKEMLLVTVLIGPLDQEPVKTQWECKTFTDDLATSAARLLDMGITEVAMESTGVYWKPVFNVWARKGLNITVGNAGHMKNVPGRKTDANDSEWIAQLHRCGMIRGSFIPEAEFQTLRLLNRHRQSLVGQRSRLKNQMEKVLEDGNIKLSSIISDLFGVFGLTMLDCLAKNQTDTATLWDRACEVTSFEKLKRKDEVKKALSNCIRPEHSFLIKQILQQYRGLERYIHEVDQELEQKLKPYQQEMQLLDEIPGVDKTLAAGLLAEATNDMDAFKDDRSFAAWCGVAAGNNESARKKKISLSQRQPLHPNDADPGSPSCCEKKGTFYHAKYWKLRSRLGSANKAKVAIANSIARTIYHVLKNKEKYKDLGAHRVQAGQDQQIKRLVGKLKALGVDVSFHYEKKIIQAKMPVEITV